MWTSPGGWGAAPRQRRSEVPVLASSDLKGLNDAPRCGQPRKCDDEKVDELVVKTLTEIPENATHWSVRSMAAAVGVMRSFVSGCGGPSS